MERSIAQSLQLKSSVRQSRQEKARYKRLRQSRKAEYGSDRGGRFGGSIGSRRTEPPGWKERDGCQCALHYGGECRDYIPNSNDVPRRRSRNRPTVPRQFSKCNRCHRIGHYARECSGSRFDNIRNRGRVEYGDNDDSMMITVYNEPAAAAGV